MYSQYSQIGYWNISLNLLHLSEPIPDFIYILSDKLPMIVLKFIKPILHFIQFYWSYHTNPTPLGYQNKRSKSKSGRVTWLCIMQLQLPKQAKHFRKRERRGCVKQITTPPGLPKRAKRFSERERGGDVLRNSVPLGYQNKETNSESGRARGH